MEKTRNDARSSSSTLPVRSVGSLDEGFNTVWLLAARMPFAALYFRLKRNESAAIQAGQLDFRRRFGGTRIAIFIQRATKTLYAAKGGKK